MAFSRRTPLRAYLFFEVFPIYGGRNVNDVEEFQRRLNPFSFNPIWKISERCIRFELDLDGLKMLVDSSTGSLVEPERTSGSWTVDRSDCT